MSRKIVCVHFVGAPGSGKSTIARRVHSSLVALLQRKLPFVEMSEVVHEWLQVTHQSASVLSTPIGSEDLRRFLCTKYDDGLNIVSGVREPHLLQTEPYWLSQIILVVVQAPKAVRRKRYEEIGKGDVFNEAEKRAVDLGLGAVEDFTPLLRKVYLDTGNHDLRRNVMSSLFAIASASARLI